jgi:predicted nucleotidyltransferase
MTVFTPSDRARVHDRVLQLASSDTRVVAGAVVGSLARDEGDRWSDLDLTFAVADGVPVHDVLEDWTCLLAPELDAVHLFDLPAGASIYRVFLLPGCLQFDLSFTPASEFGPRGPKFRLLFGTAPDRPHAHPPPARELFGYAVHHALRARFCVERGRYWQAEYWISGVRDYALSLACRRRGLPAQHARGFDDLPADVREAFRDALPGSLDRCDLLRALGGAIAGLLREAGEVREVAVRVEPALRALTIPWDAGTR